jgi:hypothetical protein
LGGKVSQKSIRLDLNRPHNRLNLSIKGVDLQQLVALHQIEGVSAQGRISAQLPIQLSAKGVKLEEGKIHGEPPGGRIRYQPVDGGAALARTAGQAADLLKILQDYHYHQLEAVANYQPSGDLTLNLAFKGRNPELYGEQPIHFNLNLEQNLLSLFESLRAVQGINERLDQTVRQFHKNRSQ